VKGKRHIGAAGAWAVLLLIGVPSWATGQNAYGATALVTSPIASVNGEDATASGSEIPLADRAAASESVADAIIEAPGTRPFRRGILGSFTSASLRGADAEHTAVLLGDLPISRADASAFNLDTIPVSMLDKVVVYRGGAPIWLSQGEIGGLIQLVPKRARTSFVSGIATGGSFGLIEARGDGGVYQSEQLTSVYSSVGIRSSNGQFDFVSDNNTSLDPSDDYRTHRENADALDGHQLLYLRTPMGSGNIDAVLMGFERVAGEPGSVSAPAFQARRLYSRYLGSASYQLGTLADDHSRGYRLQFLTGSAFERSRFTDLYKEVGAFQTNTEDQNGSVMVRTAGSFVVTNFLEWTALINGRYEAFSREDPFARLPFPPSARASAAAASELNFHGRLLSKRFELRPSVRCEYARADLHHADRFGDLSVTRASSSVPTYRLAAVLELAPGVALSASGATGKRVPSILELFGDGGWLLGNPGLRAEKSLSLDTGLVLQGQRGPLRGSAEVRVFSLDVTQRIIYVANSLHQLVPLNLRSSEIIGLEIGLRGEATRFIKLCASTTLMDTEGKPGKQLPNRPYLIAHLQPEFITPRFSVFDAVTFFVETSYVSASFNDPENVSSRISGVFTVNSGVFAEAFDRGCELRLTVRDLFNRQGEDLLGYQLPGRMFLASLSYRKDLL
jgi:vitamin B12 transporter